MFQNPGDFTPGGKKEFLTMEHDNLNELLLEKLKTYSQKPNECVEGVRSVAARLHGRASSQDKLVKSKTLERIWQKNQGGLTLVLYMLETVRDPLTAVSLAGILHECVAAKTGKNRSPAVSQLVHLNATQSLTKQLNVLQVKESIPVNDILIQEIIWTLSQLAQRDSKFSLKTRLLGAVKTFHYFLKAYNNHAKLLYPILLIIKALSRNSNTAAVLAKDGVVSTMEKVLSNIGFTPSVKLRLTLNIISYLSKNKICCSRIIQSNVLSLILRIFERWERYEGRTKLKICHYSIVTLQRVCYLKHGRKAVRSLSGVSVLYKFCQNCPEDKLYDQILSRVCGIVNFCLERKTLPVEDTCNPAKFVLPVVSDSVLADKSCFPLRDATPDFDEGDSEDELLDDVEEDGVVQIQGADPDESKILPQVATERDVEDLKMYSNFCKEFVSPSEENVTAPSRFGQNPKSGSKTLFAIKNERSKTMLGDLYNKCTFLAVDKGRYLTTNIKFLSKEKLHNLDMRFISSEVSLTNKYRPNVTVENFLERRKMSVESVIASSKKTASNTGQPKVYSKEDLISLNVLRNLHQEHGMLHAYSMIASQVKSVLPFVKVAYPDLMGGEGLGKLEPLSVKDRKVCRQKLLESVDKGFQPANNMWNVVYDLDSLISSTKTGSEPEKRDLFNNDEKRIGEKHPQNHLLFESRFESGNLRKVIQIGPREYELILNSDVNSDRHHNWFYFEVYNMDDAGPYTFNIVNFEKMNSQFNYGMKPILYSVQEALLGRPGWVRAGSDICYFRNSYQKTTGQQKCYFTTTFSITFQHNSDICYVAYHFPYTYSQLLSRIWKWSCSINYAITYFRAEPLCETLNGNQLPVLTITAVDSSKNEFSDRETIFLTARVHPGESNASWIMLGTLQFLLSSHPQAVSLRNRYVFKIVPMLNVEGVINGCARCGLSNEDLNRRWKNPHPILHPEIYHTKGLLEYCCRVLKKPPFVFCDFHGHSRKKNVFLYGCANSESWSEADKQQMVSPVEYLLIAHLMKHFCPAFSFSSCKFRVERSREATARVAIWRDFKIKRSYTMESSYCGCDQGVYAGRHLDTIHLKEVGKQFCEALACLHDETTWRLELLLESQEAAAKFGEATGTMFPRATKSGSQSDLLENSESSDDSDEEHENDNDDNDVEEEF